MTPTRKNMELYLAEHAEGEVVEDTGNEILYADPDGLYASMYSFPGGDVLEEDYDPLKDFYEAGGNTGNLAYTWDEVDDRLLNVAYKAVKGC